MEYCKPLELKPLLCAKAGCTSNALEVIFLAGLGFKSVP